MLKNLRGCSRKPKGTHVLAKLIEEKSKDHHQGHPDESELLW